MALWRARMVFQDALRYRVVLEINDSLQARVTILEDQVSSVRKSKNERIANLSYQVVKQGEISDHNFRLYEYWKGKSNRFKWQRNAVIGGVVLYTVIRIFKPP